LGCDNSRGLRAFRAHKSRGEARAYAR